ncbi:TMEM175 family protein [Streptomyces sp. NPDC102467]|uniref:TMEM175 family protein n=1 Tax=Streptomyces sp. NPDC102467 TaxID=3366179 RepID=UPI0037F55B57
MNDSSVDAKDLDRLTALSDGIFAIAMTLLVLDIHVTSGLDADAFRHMLHDLLPKVGAYALSFAILANLWRDHRRILQQAQRTDAVTVRLALAGLGVIALLPFPTTMLSEYASQPLAVVVYAATIIVIDLLQLALLLAIHRRPNLARPDAPHVAGGIVADLGSTVLVFAITIPIAFASPAAAMWCWLAQLPLRFALGRSGRGRRALDVG